MRAMGIHRERKKHFQKYLQSCTRKSDMGDGVSGGITDDLNFSLENWFILMPSPRIKSVKVTTNLKRKCWDTALKFKTQLEPLCLPDFPGGSDGKVSVYNVGGPGSIPRLGRTPGEGNGNPLQYYCLENPRTEEPGSYSPRGRKEPDTTERLHSRAT